MDNVEVDISDFKRSIYTREKKPEAITVAAITTAAEGEKILCIESLKSNTLGEFTLSCARAAKD
jgi:hypothetical protein